MIADLVAPAPSFESPDRQTALANEADAYVERALTMLRRARALVAADRSSSLELLTARRSALGGLFQRYQKFKHGQIFDPVVRHGRASSRVIAQTMKLDCMELGETFSAYHNRWLGCRAKDWDRYARDMLATTEMLMTNLAAELRAMRQLLMISDLYRG